MNSNNSLTSRLVHIANLFVGLAILCINVAAQIPAQPPPATEEESYTWWYLTLAVLFFGLIGVIFWKIKGAKIERVKQTKKTTTANKKKDVFDYGALDADRELEWLRKNQNIMDRRRRKRPTVDIPNTSGVFKGQPNTMNEVEDAIPLPVFGFEVIEPSKPYPGLTLSNDEALMSAIEQTHEEDEEDEEIRDLSIRILAAFKTRNSIEALSQMALYDVSATLRSKAISVLADHNHESVFETILLGCADPSREVRAAAARGLTRLSFDRADAWTRILEANEEWRMRHAARAAVEGGFIERCFDRLTHRDPKNAYEAFVLLALMVKSGESELIYRTVVKHPDLKLKRALLHLLKVMKDQNGATLLYNLLEENLSEEMRQEVDKVMAKMGAIMP